LILTLFYNFLEFFENISMSLFMWGMEGNATSKAFKIRFKPCVGTHNKTFKKLFHVLSSKITIDELMNISTAKHRKY
jgi:hypothetical protein